MFTLIFGFLIFILASFFCFTVTGLVILNNLKGELAGYERIILGTITGFVAFTLLSYLLYILKIHPLLLPTVLLVNIYFFRSFSPAKLSYRLNRDSALLLIIFIIGIAGQLAIIAPSGINVGGDLLFWSANGHDGAWHIALAHELQKGYPFQNPVFAGEKLVNYHFFSDITLSDFNNLFKISVLDLYFRFFPFLFSLLLGASAFIIGRKIGNSNLAGIWSVIFTYFGGSFGYIVTWLRNKSLGGESIFWGTQIQSASGNPPQIISDFLVLSFLYLFFIYIHKKNRTIFTVCLLLAGTMILFKVYAAVAILGSLAIAGIWEILKERKLYISALFLLSSITAAILYFPNSSGSGSFLIWQPWWYIRTMVVDSSRLDWIDLELRRQTYIAENNIKRVVQLEVTAFLIFFFGNLGMRFLGLVSFFKLTILSFRNYFYLTVIAVALISLIFPLLFLQKGVAGNTSQFFQYFILILGILSGVTTAQLMTLLKSNLLKILISFTILLLAVPTQIGLLYEFYSRPAFTKITKEEVAALSFLKNHTTKDSTIMSPPYNKYLDLKEVTPNIWDWFDTAYVSALSERRTYFADYEQVDIMGYNYQDRLTFEQEIFDETSSTKAAEKLRDKDIGYLYFPKYLVPKFPAENNFELVYQNNGAQVWKVIP